MVDPDSSLMVFRIEKKVLINSLVSFCFLFTAANISYTQTQGSLRSPKIVLISFLYEKKDEKQNVKNLETYLFKRFFPKVKEDNGLDKFELPITLPVERGELDGYTGSEIVDHLDSLDNGRYADFDIAIWGIVHYRSFGNYTLYLMLVTNPHKNKPFCRLDYTIRVEEAEVTKCDNVDVQKKDEIAIAHEVITACYCLIPRLKFFKTEEESYQNEVVSKISNLIKVLPRDGITGSDGKLSRFDQKKNCSDKLASLILNLELRNGEKLQLPISDEMYAAILKVENSNFSIKVQNIPSQVPVRAKLLNTEDELLIVDELTTPDSLAPEISWLSEPKFFENQSTLAESSKAKKRFGFGISFGSAQQYSDTKITPHSIGTGLSFVYPSDNSSNMSLRIGWNLLPFENQKAVVNGTATNLYYLDVAFDKEIVDFFGIKTFMMTGFGGVGFKSPNYNRVYFDFEMLLGAGVRLNATSANVFELYCSASYTLGDDLDGGLKTNKFKDAYINLRLGYTRFLVSKP